MRFSALDGLTVIPAGSLLIHSTNAYDARPRGARCWGEAVNEMWSPGRLRSFEQRVFLSEALVRIPSDLPPVLRPVRAACHSYLMGGQEEVEQVK